MSLMIDIPGADTIIMVSNERRYRMHSAQLIQSSRGFAHLLEVPGPNLSREGLRVGIRYLIILQDFDEASNKPIYPVFRRITVDQDGRPAHKFGLMHESDKNPRVRPTLFFDYDRLLRVFVNMPVTFEDKNVDALLPDSMGLLEVAERLGAVSPPAAMVSYDINQSYRCLWSKRSWRTT
jgi:hypothetical protein